MVLITTNEFIQKATTEGRCQINSIMEHTNTKNKNCLCQDVFEYWGVIFLSFGLFLGGIVNENKFLCQELPRLLVCHCPAVSASGHQQVPIKTDIAKDKTISWKIRKCQTFKQHRHLANSSKDKTFCGK